ncbi:unnamed protein product [Brassica rapa subsp. narinosa]
MAQSNTKVSIYSWLRFSEAKLQNTELDLGNKRIGSERFWASKCGKTSLINVVENVGYSEDLDPIIGFHMREVIKGNVTFKIWDASGQSRFRSSWERFVHVGPFVLLQVCS